MDETEEFLQYLLNEFRKISALIEGILKDEERIEDDILVKKGFLIKKYYLNYDKIDLPILEKLLSELGRIKILEIHLQERLAQKQELIERIEKEYEKINKKKLHGELLQGELKEVLHYSGLMITRVRQLIRMMQDGLKLHKKMLGKETEIFFSSFEHIANRIIRFAHFLGQLTNKILNFEKEAYYPEPRTYGRIMSNDEIDKTFKTGCLNSSQDPTPVFDSPRAVMENILRMSKDERKNFFKIIGVRKTDAVLFFQTKLKPVNHGRPVPQSNGLREYKFPKGINIEILKAA